MAEASDAAGRGRYDEGKFERMGLEFHELEFGDSSIPSQKVSPRDIGPCAVVFYRTLWARRCRRRWMVNLAWSVRRVRCGVCRAGVDAPRYLPRCPPHRLQGGTRNRMAPWNVSVCFVGCKSVSGLSRRLPRLCGALLSAPRERPRASARGSATSAPTSGPGRSESARGRRLLP